MGQYPYFKSRLRPKTSVILMFVFLLVSACLFPLPAKAYQHGKELNSPKIVRMDILPDRYGGREIDEVASADFAEKFIPSRRETVNFGFDRAARWVRFKITNSKKIAQEYLLEVGFPLIDHVDLYIPAGSDDFLHKKGGELIPVNQREIPYRNPTFRISLQQLEKKTCYLRYQDIGSVPFSLRLWDEKAFNHKVKARQYFQGLFYGAMIIMLFYNLIIYLTVRLKSYLFYVIYVASYLFWQATYSGLANEYLWPDHPSFSNQLLPFLICACGLGAAMFAKNFLNTKINAPRHNKVLLVMMAGFFIAIIISLQPNYTVNIIVSTLIVTMLAPTLLLTGISCWQKGFRPARYFTIAWFALLCGVTALGLKSFGLLPSTFITEYGIQIGSLLEIALLSLALADQLNVLKKEKELAQAETLKIQQDATEHLEMQVRERTKDLQTSKNKLEVLSSKLAKYLSPQLYSSIFSGKTEVKIQSQRKKLTVFFSDIVGFTELTDNMESESLTMILNEYLNEMAGIAISYGGTIDKYIGDAIMVFFGDPESRGDREDALACVEMAIAMRARMQSLQQNWKSLLAKPLNIRMGINTGYCTVGNLGSDNRLDYTIIGGPVNLASRLESMAAPGQILISYNTYAIIEDRIACRKIGEVQVRGMAYPIQTYQVVDLFTSLPPAGSDEINLTGEGYSIKLDFSRMQTDTGKKVEKILKSVLEKL